MEQKVIATVGGHQITEAEVEAFIRSLPREQQAYASHPDFRKQCEEQLIAVYAFAKYGEEEKIDETEEFKNVMENARGIENYLSFTSTRTADGELVSYGGLSIVSTLAWGLGYFGMPHILLRFMAIDDKNKVKGSRRIASIWVVIAMGVAILIGIIGNALTANGTVAPLETASASETIVLEMATVLSKHSVGAALIAGLIFAGILACTMSTSDSQLLAA